MPKAFLTGASGFIAKHVLRELLEKGYDVRASVRSEKRKAELEALFPAARLEFAFLDLTKGEGWADAMRGCDVLLHTASPFPLSEPKDPQGPWGSSAVELIPDLACAERTAARAFGDR